eukprot:12042144-Prorocentrum_lima.AAC.1
MCIRDRTGGEHGQRQRLVGWPAGHVGSASSASVQRPVASPRKRGLDVLSVVVPTTIPDPR